MPAWHNFGLPALCPIIPKILICFDIKLSVIIPVVFLKWVYYRNNRIPLLNSSWWMLMKSLKTGMFKFCHLMRVTVLLRCFIFREIHGKDSDKDYKYSRIQGSDNFQIIPLNWI